MTPCPFHRWRWEPCAWRENAFVVRCQACGVASYLVTMLVRGAGVFFAHEPYREE